MYVTQIFSVYAITGITGVITFLHAVQVMLFYCA